MATQQLQLAAALQQGLLTAATRLNGVPDLLAGLPLGDPQWSSQVFPGTPEQVAAARRFARAQLGDHPAAADAVTVTSELSANAVAHTASGRPGGVFLVHLTTLSTSRVAVMVTDQGSSHEPRPVPAGQDRESGRGLHVVTALADLFVPFGDSSGRTILAILVGPANDRHRPNELEEPSRSNQDHERDAIESGPSEPPSVVSPQVRPLHRFVGRMVSGAVCAQV